MFHIVYVSTATRPFGDADAAAVLDDARAFNQQRDVTGLLVHAAGHFLQVLEGAADDVEAAYARAAASTRHRSVLRTPALAVPARVFPQWRMGLEHAPSQLLVERVLEPLVRHDLIAGSQVRAVLLERWVTAVDDAA